MNKSLLKKLILLVLITTSIYCDAATLNWGTYADAFNAESNLLVSQDGGLGIDNAYASLVLPSLSQAQSALNGTSSTPVLSTESSYILNYVGIPGGLATSSAAAVQLYTYTGIGPQTYTLNTSLVVGTQTGDTRITSNIYIKSEMFTSLEAGAGSCNNTPQTYLSGFSTFLCGTDFGNSMFSSTSVSNTNISDSITFTLNQGDTFFLYANLNTAANQDGSISALSTLSMNFDNNSNLVATTVSTIPLPASVWLFISGLISLTSFRHMNIT